MGYIKRLLGNNNSYYEWDGIHTSAVNSNEAYEANLLKETIANVQDNYELERVVRLLQDENLLSVLERIADALEELAY